MARFAEGLGRALDPGFDPSWSGVECLLGSRGEDGAANLLRRVNRPSGPAVGRKERAMRTWSVVLTCLFIVLVGYAASGRNTATIPEVPKVQITPPPVDLTPDLAAFSGIWESPQDGALPSRLIVERIYPNWATIVYTWADHPAGDFKGGWERVRAKVQPDGKLRWGYPGKFTIRIGEDGTSIEGTKEQAGRLSTFTMKKVEPFVAQ